MALAIKQEEAADHFLGFLKRAVDDGPFSVARFDTRRLRVRFQGLRSKQLATRLQAFTERDHPRIDRLTLFGIASLALATRFNDKQGISHGAYRKSVG